MPLGSFGNHDESRHTSIRNTTAVPRLTRTAAPLNKYKSSGQDRCPSFNLDAASCNNMGERVPDTTSRNSAWRGYAAFTSAPTLLCPEISKLHSLRRGPLRRRTRLKTQSIVVWIQVRYIYIFDEFVFISWEERSIHMVICIQTTVVTLVGDFCRRRGRSTSFFRPANH